MFHFKKRLFSAIWFGVAGYLAGILGLSVASALKWHDALTSPFTFAALIIASLLGLFFGYKILLWEANPKNIFKAMRYGLWGALISLLIVDVGFILFIDYFTFIYCYPLHNCAQEFRGSLSVFLMVILGSLYTGGWSAILMGMIFAVGLNSLHVRFSKWF